MEEYKGVTKHIYCEDKDLDQDRTCQKLLKPIFNDVYEIQKQIGYGLTADVYLAVDLRNGQEIALKMIKNS